MAVDNAARARDAMPPPVELTPAAMPVDAGVARTFTSAGFESAPALLGNQQNDVLDRMDARHAEAARVMDQFQAASRDVSRTVPRFVPPDPARRPKRREHAETDVRDVPVSGYTTAASGATAVPGPVSGDGGPSASGAGGAGGGPAAGGTPGVRGDVPRSGMSVTSGPRGGTAAAWTPGGTTLPPGTASGMGAVPMGGAMGTGRDTDHERRGLGFLEEPGFWDCREGDLLVSAAVIGEVPRHE